MPEQGEASDQVEDNYPRILKHLKHHAVERQLLIIHKLVSSVRYPEMQRVHNEKQQDQRSKQAHAAAIPFTPSRMFYVAVFYRTRAAILFPKNKAFDDVQQKSDDQTNL